MCTSITQMIMDGNPRMNLASFVTTYMVKQTCAKLMSQSSPVIPSLY